MGLNSNRDKKRRRVGRVSCRWMIGMNIIVRREMEVGAASFADGNAAMISYLLIHKNLP